MVKNFPVLIAVLLFGLTVCSLVSCGDDPIDPNHGINARFSEMSYIHSAILLYYGKHKRWPVSNEDVDFRNRAIETLLANHTIQWMKLKAKNGHGNERLLVFSIWNGGSVLIQVGSDTQQLKLSEFEQRFGVKPVKH